MKKHLNLQDDLRPEYDFSSMKGAVRGKHAKEYREGTNVVVLRPEIAEAFPTEDAVNEALKGILNTTRAVRRTGGLANKTLLSQAPSRSGKHRSSRSRPNS